jgi:hypothetical protein
MKRALCLVGSFVVGAVAASCGGHSQGATATDVRPAAATRGGNNVITRQEIEGTSGSNAYEIIQRLRPIFLSKRGAVRSAPTNGTNAVEAVDLVVYLNNNRLGGSDQLKSISQSDIGEIRYYSASDATTKWGLGHTAGAIQVISR